jgi:GPH family glycoside/pentoside/hexuronide:cation symporter
MLAPPAPVSARLPLGLKAGWGLGSAGTITVLNTNSLLLLFFLTTVVGFGPALAGTLLFAAKLVDALMAPALGGISDRTRSRMGRRRPYMLAGALLSALAVAFVFRSPTGAGEAALPYVAGCLVLLAAGYTLFNVPYLAMPAELTPSPAERTSLVSWRIGFLSAGGLVTGFAPQLAVKAGYPTVGVVLGAVVLLAMGAAVVATAPASNAQPSGVRAAGGFKAWAPVFSNRPFMLVMAAKVCQLVGLASISASALFLFTTALARDARTAGFYIAASTAASILSMPLWVRLGRRADKRVLYIAGCLGFSLVTLSWLLAARGEPMPLIVGRGLVAGLFSGGLLLMGQSLLPDAIDYDCRRSGVRREGVYAGFYSFVEKTSMAFGPLLVGLILQQFGFNAKLKIQPSEATTGILIGAALLPAALYALSVVPLLGGALSARRLAGDGVPERAYAGAAA